MIFPPRHAPILFVLLFLLIAPWGMGPVSQSLGAPVIRGSGSFFRGMQVLSGRDMKTAFLPSHSWRRQTPSIRRKSSKPQVQFSMAARSSLRKNPVKVEDALPTTVPAGTNSDTKSTAAVPSFAPQEGILSSLSKDAIPPTTSLVGTNAPATTVGIASANTSDQSHPEAAAVTASANMPAPTIPPAAQSPSSGVPAGEKPEKAAPPSPVVLPDAQTVIDRVHTQEKVAALTIDLGESLDRESLLTILDYLETQKLHCTFFITGWFIRTHPDLLEKVHSLGHDFANHTDKHPHCRKVTAERLRDELSTVEWQLRAHHFQMSAPLLWRPPFGEYNSSVVRTAAEAGYRTVTWSATSLDYDLRTNPDRAALTILRHMQPGGIVLCHATKVSKDTIPKVVKALTDSGYKFLTVRDLLAY